MLMKLTVLDFKYEGKFKKNYKWFTIGEYFLQKNFKKHHFCKKN